MHKIKPTKVTAGTVKIKLKEQLKGLLQVIIIFIYEFSQMNIRIQETIFIWCNSYGQSIRKTHIFSDIALLCVDLRGDPVNIYLFNVDNRNTRKKCEICSKLTIKKTLNK